MHLLLQYRLAHTMGVRVRVRARKPHMCSYHIQKVIKSKFFYVNVLALGARTAARATSWCTPINFTEERDNIWLPDRFFSSKREIFMPKLMQTIAFSHQNNCKHVDHKIADVKKNYLLSCASNFFLQMRILWEGNITWFKLLLNTKISLTALSGLEKKQDDVL